MLINDIGIILEIIGFVLLLFTASRNPHQSLLALGEHKESPFDTLREKIIPDKHVYWVLVFGIGLVILGLFFQFSKFNS